MKSKEKKYIAVKKFILKGIREGKYQPGTKIPPEDEIMRITGFSRSPVRHAVSQLEQEGHIFKIHGSGSFVKHMLAEQSIDIYALLYPNSKGIEKDFIHGMRQAVNNSKIKNLHLILKKPGNNTQEMIEILQSLDINKRGGIIIVPQLDPDRAMNRLLAANLRKIEKENLVVVQLDRCVPEYEGSIVMCDHRSGAFNMVQHLIELGHERIAVIYEHPENSSIKLRLQGAQECLENHGLSLPEEYQLQFAINDIARNGSSIVDRMRKDKISAVFCFESEIALEIYMVFQEHNIAVPEEVSLCSFDDHSFTRFLGGFITAVIQPLEELGYFAVDLILRELEKKSHRATKMILEPDIVERQSVARI